MHFPHRWGRRNTMAFPGSAKLRGECGGRFVYWAWVGHPWDDVNRETWDIWSGNDMLDPLSAASRWQNTPVYVHSMHWLFMSIFMFAVMTDVYVGMFSSVHCLRGTSGQGQGRDTQKSVSSQGPTCWGLINRSFFSLFPSIPYRPEVSTAHPWWLESSKAASFWDVIFLGANSRS